MKESDPLPGLVILVVIFALGSGFYASIKSTQLSAKMTRTQALVIGKEERETRFAGIRPSSLRLVTVQFTDKSGKLRNSQAVVNDVYDYRRLKRNDRIPIRYDVRDPGRVELAS